MNKVSAPRAGLQRLLDQSERVAETCARFDVNLLVAHGSATYPYSSTEPNDLDLAVLFAHSSPKHDLVGLLDQLAEVAQSPDLDIMVLNGANAVARERALTSPVMLYESSPGLVLGELTTATLERMDTQWLRDLELSRLAHGH